MRHEIIDASQLELNDKVVSINVYPKLLKADVPCVSLLW